MATGYPPTYSVRRQYLDRDLGGESAVLTGRVLEIGCGRQGRRGRFQPPAGSGVSWTFLDRDLVRRPHVCADAARLPVRSSAFDVVVCLEVLEYVSEPLTALTEIRRLLRPSGTLLLSTPFMHRMDSPADCWRFTEAGLRQLLAAAGFSVERCLSQGGAFAVAASVLRYVVSTRGPVGRRVLHALLGPVIAGLLWSDAIMAKRHPELGTFTTGYLVVARRAAPETV
jgi:SAM-dependent methyltransferase